MAKRVESINDIVVPFIINFFVLLFFFLLSASQHYGEKLDWWNTGAIGLGTFAWGLVILPAWVFSRLDLL